MTTIVKSMGEKNGYKTGYLHSLKVSTHKILFNYKGKRKNFVVGTPGQQDLNEVSEVNGPPAMRHTSITRLLIHTRRTQYRLCDILAPKGTISI